MSSPALAKQVHLPLGTFGTSAQPAFTAPVGLAVDQSSGDLYAVDRGRNEVQSVTVSATAGQFKLKFGGQSTPNLAFNANSETVQTALRNLSTIGPEGVFLKGGPGDAGGSHPYVVEFQVSLGKTDVEQLTCENGTTPLSGGSGCTVITTAPGVKSTIARFGPNGEPADFTALEGGATNVIDGLGAGDGTPQNGLVFGENANELQIAVDDSGTATDGDLYVTQAPKHAVDVFASSGQYLGQLTEYKEGPAAEGPLKPFSEACGVGVDSAGNAYLGDYEKGIHKLKQPLVPHNPLANADNVANFALSQVCTLAAGAGPTAGYLFADTFTGELFKLDASTGAKQYGGHPITTGVTTVTVDPATGYLYVARGSEVIEYDASGSTEAKLLSAVSVPSKVTGIAVDKTSGNLYVAREGSSHLEVFGPLVTVPDVSTEAATGIGPVSATLHGTISADNGPAAHCSFQYTTEAAYLADKAIPGHDGFAGAGTKACEPAGPFSGSTLTPVSAKAEPLGHETKYRFRIVGENEHTASPGDDPGAALGFETFGKPRVKGTSVAEVTTDSAKVEGEVNPSGQATAFAVQYVTEADFKASGYNKATSVPSPPEDLGNGAVFLPVSEELSELQPETAYRFRLVATNADGTVTGPEGAFATYPVPTGLPDGRAYELVSPPHKLGEVFPAEKEGGTCINCIPGTQAQKMPMQAAPDGNAVSYEGNPFAQGLAAGANQYVASRAPGGWQTTALSGPQFSGAKPQGFKAFSSDLSKAVLYQVEPALSEEAPPNFADLYLAEAGKAELTPLITTANEPHNRPPGVLPQSFALTYAGADAAFDRIVFEANDALTAAVPGTAPLAPPVSATETDLYEWSGGQLHLINVKPGNTEAVPNAVIGSGRALGAGSGSPDFDHAVSADGQRVFWSAPSGQVFVREGGTATVELADHAGKFLTATPDGAKALLSDGCLYTLATASCEDLTLDESHTHRGGFQGILGASEDLSRAYFVDTEVLAANQGAAHNAAGEAQHAEATKDNLYAWQGGATSFVAVLAAGDDQLGEFGEVGAWRASPADRTAQASADGRYLAFMSRAPLTGHPSPPEVFEYDAATAKLACASCNPTGRPPLGLSKLTLVVFRGATLGGESLPQPHYLAPDGHGRLFFNSQDVLSTADLNGHIQDVYEWEPKGVGSCESAFDEGGCVSLISSGQGEKDSQFLDTTPSGDDAFFTTRVALVPADKDDFMDLYDARIGGGIEESATPPCAGEACKGASSLAPEQPSAASATFAGPGNETPSPRCAPGKALRRGKCLKKPGRHRHHSKAAKHKRGASR